MTLLTVSVIDAKLWPGSIVEAAAALKKLTAAPSSVKTVFCAVAASIGASSTFVTVTATARVLVAVPPAVEAVTIMS